MDLRLFWGTRHLPTSAAGTPTKHSRIPQTWKCLKKLTENPVLGREASEEDPGILAIFVSADVQMFRLLRGTVAWWQVSGVRGRYPICFQLVLAVDPCPQIGSCGVVVEAAADLTGEVVSWASCFFYHSVAAL